MRVGVVALVWIVAAVVTVVKAAPADSEAEAALRTERSANLSHITGTARKIRMYVKNRFLQLMPDGTVNGTAEDTTEYSILQRQSVRVGQVKIQGVATCLYLCMDSCGLLYASREFAEDCVFNEMIEQHHYNTYSSTKYSNHRRTVYLALNRRGVPRRVQIKASAALGKLSAYTRVLTQTVAADEVEALAKRLLQQHPGSQHHHLRHHQLCPPAPRAAPPETADVERCRKRKKRRKRRRCKEGEDENEDCHKPKDEGKKRTVIVRKRCEEGEGKEKCQQQKKLHMIGRKRKSRHDTKRLLRHLPSRSQVLDEEDEEEDDHEHEHEEHDDTSTALDDDDVMTTDATPLLETNNQ